MPSSTGFSSETSTTAGVANSSNVACGVTAAVGVESGLAPTALAAFTRNV